MRKTINILTAAVAIILMSSFTNKNANEFIGTFSVSASDPSQIKLTINSDHTFYYQDFSNPSKKIVANGSWISKGKKVILKDANSSMHFHNVWTFVDNGQVAKSHKGFTFYRLGKVEG